MFLHIVGPICFLNIHGWAIIRLNFWGNLLEKSAFWASKLRNWPLLKHGPVIEILRYYLHENLGEEGIYFDWNTVIMQHTPRNFR